MGYIGQAPANKVVTTSDIEDDAITSAKIATGTVVAADLGANSVDSSELVDGSIDTSHIADDQITLAKMASGTDGNIISYDASGNPVAIATGSDGQVLTSTGAGSPPAFEAAAGFDVTSITGATALGATPADTDEFVLSDAGTLKRVDYSHLKSLFGKVGFSARRDSSAITLNHATVTDVVFNTEIKDTNSAYNESTGVFTAPVTGFYFIGCTWSFRDAQGNMADHQMNINIGGSMYQVHRTENTSNGALFTALGGSWASIMGTISSGTAIKMQCRIETNDSSTGELSHSDYNSTFWGWNLA